MQVQCPVCNEHRELVAECGKKLARYKRGTPCRSCAAGRTVYTPGHIALNSVVLWPEHPLASGGGLVSLNRLKIWQDQNYVEAFLELSKAVPSGSSIRAAVGRPISLRIDPKGRIWYRWMGHPLANKSGCIYEHQLVYWQETGYDERVLELLATNQATVHHRNTVRDDNRPENLELRLRHPVGNNKKDWIHMLELEGYTIIPPIKEEGDGKNLRIS